MITEYFQTNPQKVNIKSDYMGKVIYPKIFKLETGSDLLLSLHDLAKKENKGGYIY